MRRKGFPRERVYHIILGHDTSDWHVDMPFPFSLDLVIAMENVFCRHNARSMQKALIHLRNLSLPNHRWSLLRLILRLLEDLLGVL